MIVSGMGATPTDSVGYPWNARYTISSGNLLADFRSNVTADSQGRLQICRFYETTADHGVLDLLSYLIARRRDLPAQLLECAQDTVRITMDYFVPTPELVWLLEQTARRGVDLQVLVPGPHHDHPVARMAQEHQYASLMESGVRMWAYHQPTMLHAKSFTVDGTAACVGSPNLDHRSLSKDDELVTVI